MPLLKKRKKGKVPWFMVNLRIVEEVIDRAKGKKKEEAQPSRDS